MFTRIRLPFGCVKECCYMGVSPEVDGSGLDVSDPAVPVLTGSVEKKISDYSDYLGSMRAQFLPGGKVLWVPDGADTGSYPCMRCIGIAEDVMFEGPDFWAPSGSGSWLIVTDSSDASEPRILSTTRMIDNDDYRWE